MKSLTTYIIEAVGENGGKFDNTTNTLDELLGQAQYLNIVNAPKYIQDAFDNLVKSGKSNLAPYIYAKAKAFFKMPYSFGPQLESALNGLRGIRINRVDSKKIKVYYKPEGSREVQLMETGSGSINKIPTSLQESSTCFVFNAYMDAIEKGGDLSCIDNEEYINDVLGDLFEGSKIDQSWIISFSFQVKALVDYVGEIVKELGGDTKIYNYRLARYGGTGEKEVVSKAYSKMVSAYARKIGGRKDAYDPTDIILFDKTKVNEITKCCKEGHTPEECVEIKTEFLKKCFKERICMGVALKKLSENGRIELYNTGTHNVVNSITGFEIVPTKGKNNITVLCTGAFNFDGIVDEEGKPVTQEKQVVLTMRTFGSNIIALDATLRGHGKNDGPAIGKCPSKIWREMIDAEKDGVSECIKKFEKFLGNKASMEDIKTLITGAIKEGPHCFPFILLH